jgi:o-succinylbenzoate---CoA ligase
MPCPLKEAARLAPYAPCFEKATFQEQDSLADKMALFLEKAGILAGDRIALLHRPTRDSAALFFAAWRIGALLCPLSLRLPPTQIESHLKRLDARVLIDSFPLSNLRLRVCRHPPHTQRGALLFTSGSTALPKIAALPLENLLSNAAPLVERLALKHGDRWLLNLPLYHVGGIGVLLRSALAHAAIVLDEKDPEITHISAVPTQLYRKSPVYKNLRCLLIGGAPISTFPEHLPCYLTYGLTEMGSLVTLGTQNLGVPLPERELRVSPTGEILVRGKCLFEGYWEEGRLSKPFDGEGWFHTGDLGQMSADGLTVTGRIDWQFISGGENIQPEEIEQQLLNVAGVIEAAVVPVDDLEFGQRPVALLAASGVALDPAFLKKALSERLPKFKIPVRFLYIDGELPKNGLKNHRKAIAEIAIKMFN